MACLEALRALLLVVDGWADAARLCMLCTELSSAVRLWRGSVTTLKLVRTSARELAAIRNYCARLQTLSLDSCKLGALEGQLISVLQVCSQLKVVSVTESHYWTTSERLTTS